jgi:colicin import membrane protein
MRPAELPPESIIEAGQELQAAGRNITGFALRQKVGGGNPSRLKQVWDEHLASQSVTKAEPVAELPDRSCREVAAVTKALTERLATLAVELNDKAVKAAERRVHEVVRSAGEQREQAERELADASQTVDDLEAKLDQATAKPRRWKANSPRCRPPARPRPWSWPKLRERLTVTEQTAKTAEAQHAAELARMNAAIEADRARHQQEAEQLRAELADQKKANQAATAERDQARAELATVKAKAEAADQAHQEQRKTAEREAQRAAERIAKAEADQVQANKEASAAREDAAKLRGQAEAMQTQIVELMRMLSERSAPDSQS